MNGKGSKPRPMEVERDVYEDNWDRIFGNKDLKFTNAGEYMEDREAGQDQDEED